MRRVLLALLLSAGAAVAGAAPAAAGGPTSVLVTNPSQARAEALYYNDAEYAELDRLLHGPGAVAEAGAGPGAEPTTYLNVTWLVHDVSVWRTDTVALGSTGAAWVATQLEFPDEEPSSREPDWNRLHDGDRLLDLVASLGLLRAGHGGSTGDGTGSEQVTAPSAGDAEPASVVATPRPSVREETRWFSLSGWRWAVPGLLVGALGASLALRRRGEGTPRRELIDRQPEPAL